jgi:ribonucleoside-diphosphate reductase alpha chain
MNAGTKLGQLSACFVLPVEDSLENIFNSLKYMAIIQQSGGGTGFSFSHLRPRGDIVKSTKGIASGPVSFLRIFDAATEVIKQGGKRRGANMGILDANHPDILEFVISKQKEKQLSNFNISVAVEDEFMRAVEKNEDYAFINPKNKKLAGKIKAKGLFDVICQAAWKTGDPGMIFIDEINRKNQVPGMGKLEATNPCGEVPLLPYESCNLGSINLTKIVEKGKINWNKLREIVHLSTRFLDNVIDANKYPFPELEKMALGNRRIGLGVMDFAEMLILMGVPYDSKEAVAIAEKLMSFINKESHIASEQLGKEKGNFLNFDKSVWKKSKHMRNCACTTIAPTGTISIIAGCSSGIEPLFALAFMREVLSGKHLFETNKIFQSELIKEGFYSEELIKKVAFSGNLKNVKLPERIKKLFKTALEISAEQHIKIQAAFQKYTDNAVSKTINLPNNATPKDIEKAYLLAYKSGCKGITIYRYGSKPEQVLYLGEGKEYSKASMEFTGGTCIGSVCLL